MVSDGYYLKNKVIEIRATLFVVFLENNTHIWIGEHIAFSVKKLCKEVWVSVTLFEKLCIG